MCAVDRGHVDVVRVLLVASTPPTVTAEERKQIDALLRRRR
jgi:hypothetical protein